MSSRNYFIFKLYFNAGFVRNPKDRESEVST